MGLNADTYELFDKVDELTDELADAYKRIDALQAMLDEVHEFLDNRADGEYVDGRFEANPELRLMCEIEDVLR